MVQETALLLLGLVMVLVGAEGLVSGASALARRWGVSELVIGLTIVAMGTSAPEMVVSFISASEGNSDMAVGNIIGSNIFNTALILGLSAVICPMVITKGSRKRDIPVNVAATLLLILFGMKKTLFGIGDDGITRIEGAIFLVFFVWYMVQSFRKDKENRADLPAEALSAEPEAEEKPMGLFKSIVFLLAGLAGLVYGGELFVDHAQVIAEMAGLSDKFIAITVLAAGTSLPELATSVVAAIKGKGQLALGNIIGSNIFNILLILGGSALIHPISMAGVDQADYGALLFCAVSLVIFSLTFKRNRLDRVEGAFLVLIEASYMTYLFMTI